MLSRIPHKEDDCHYRVETLDFLRSKIKARLEREPVEADYESMALRKQVADAPIRIRFALAYQFPALLS